jgi:hypothetical protein
MRGFLKCLLRSNAYQKASKSERVELIRLLLLLCLNHDDQMMRKFFQHEMNKKKAKPSRNIINDHMIKI